MANLIQKIADSLVELTLNWSIKSPYTHTPIAIGPLFSQRATILLLIQIDTLRWYRFFFSLVLQNCYCINQRRWLQQAGASHTFNDSIAAFLNIFGHKLISNRGDITWSPRRPDLSPMDSFLWAYHESEAYINNPKCWGIERNIWIEMRNIPTNIYRAVMQHFCSRL